MINFLDSLTEFALRFLVLVLLFTVTCGMAALAVILLKVAFR